MFWCEVPSASKGNAVSEHVPPVYFANILTDSSKPCDKTDTKLHQKQ